ncbi:MAG TPA: enoyl-CoA hydratase-related protein [Candidatus Cryosericum sp.]|nr:enoyl-CoA hydratase-related protein [Candidatus Cryosericum sp.]
MSHKEAESGSGFRLRVAGRAATLTLDLPPLNVLTIASCRALHEAVHLLSNTSDVGVLVVEGAGKAFSAGVDIGEHRVETAATMLHAFHAFCRSLLDFPRPTIARVHGPALGGGCEVVLCCDLAVAAATATLGLPEITLGVFPPLAAMLLPRLSGRRAAATAILWGEVLPAEAAQRLGLVSETVPDERLNEVVARRAARSTELSGAALRLARRAIRRGPIGTCEEALKDIEAIYLQELMRTEDATEGLNAFLEKRPPSWKHR